MALEKLEIDNLELPHNTGSALGIAGFEGD